MPAQSAKMPIPLIIATRPASTRAGEALRNLVAIAGGRQRNHRPPHRQGDATELVRLGVALDDIGRERRSEQNDAEDRECTPIRLRASLVRTLPSSRKKVEPRRSQQPDGSKRL